MDSYYRPVYPPHHHCVPQLHLPPRGHPIHPIHPTYPHPPHPPCHPYHPIHPIYPTRTDIRDHYAFPHNRLPPIRTPLHIRIPPHNTTPRHVRTPYPHPGNRITKEGTNRVTNGAPNRTIERKDRLNTSMNAGRPKPGIMEPDIDMRMNDPHACPYARYVSYRRMGWGPQV